MNTISINLIYFSQLIHTSAPRYSDVFHLESGTSRCISIKVLYLYGVLETVVKYSSIHYTNLNISFFLKETWLIPNGLWIPNVEWMLKRMKENVGSHRFSPGVKSGSGTKPQQLANDGNPFAKPLHQSMFPNGKYVVWYVCFQMEWILIKIEDSLV
jgi:hypothetical protein